MPDTPRAAMTREQVRDVDRRAMEEYGLSGLVLMENAGRGAADLLLKQGTTGPVVICCGKGNNGGDGFVVARHLEATGVRVEVLLFADPNDLAGDAAANLRVLQKAGTPVTPAGGLDGADLAVLLQSADWIVDALLGTGVSGEVRGRLREAIDAINASGRPVMAVDLPSGMDCNTGQPCGVCIKAALTATFVARKVGFDADGASEHTGAVEVLPIGVPRRLLDV